MLHSFAAVVIIVIVKWFAFLHSHACLCVCVCVCIRVLSIVDCSVYSAGITTVWFLVIVQQTISFVKVGDQCIFCNCQNASIELCLFELCLLSLHVVYLHLFNDDIWKTWHLCCYWSFVFLVLFCASRFCVLRTYHTRDGDIPNEDLDHYI